MIISLSCISLQTDASLTPSLYTDFIDFGWDSFDESTKLEKRAIELNNGRAAMMGLLALWVHEELGVSIIPSV